jgi:tRNA threonylcarbamoyladenosine biosynthesis protein TsaE
MLYNEFISYSETETFEFAKSLSNKANAGELYAIYGDLGAGKTVFAKGFAKGLLIEEEITSPTFTVLEEYFGRLPLYHFDLYRIDNDIEFENLNFEDYWFGGGICIVEWPQKAGNRLPNNSIKVNISYIDETSRKISIEYPNN